MIVARGILDVPCWNYQVRTNSVLRAVCRYAERVKDAARYNTRTIDFSGKSEFIHRFME